MKRISVSLLYIIAAASLSLAACSSKSGRDSNVTGTQHSISAAEIEKIEESADSLEPYKAFLQGGIPSKGEDESRFLDDFCQNDSDHTQIRYALFDMTGDEWPELHVLTDGGYSIHTIRNDRLLTWYTGDKRQRPLNNRAVLERVESTNGTHYAYIVLDNKGKDFFVARFSEPRRGSKTKHLFSIGNDYDADVKLTKADWDKLTEPFLSIGSDQIIWKEIRKKDGSLNWY